MQIGHWMVLIVVQIASGGEEVIDGRQLSGAPVKTK